jgi:hypothetical protein
MFQRRPMRLAQVCSCWNWKCALMSATARSLVYLAATIRTGLRGSLAIVLVEVAYVTLTAGIYAGMQQRALGLRTRWLGNLIVALGVPALAQTMDWITHRLTGPAVAPKAILAVCIFTLLSALFHLHVMRNGAFLTGGKGRSLVDDFRRMPRLIAGFVIKPVTLLSARLPRATSAVESEAAL